MARLIIPRGREALRRVRRWLPPKPANARWAGNINYGVQPFTEPILDEPVDTVTTYSDLLGWLLLGFGTNARYLEIGVSVGKNLHQVHAHATNSSAAATLVGLDLEPFNPMLLPLHPQRTPLVASWPTPESVAEEAQTPPANGADRPSTRSLKQDATSTVAQHGDPASSTRLYYVSADLKTSAAWDAVMTQVSSPKGEQGFDLIFSDAWHSAAAVMWELRQIIQRSLLTPRTVLVWDDLDTQQMQQGFGRMCLTLRELHPAVVAAREAGAEATPKIDCFLSAVAPGWVASNTSNLIGLIGPVDVLDASGLRYVLPSRLRLREFGFDLPDP